MYARARRASWMVTEGLSVFPAFYSAFEFSQSRCHSPFTDVASRISLNNFTLYISMNINIIDVLNCIIIIVHFARENGNNYDIITSLLAFNLQQIQNTNMLEYN